MPPSPNASNLSTSLISSKIIRVRAVAKGAEHRAGDRAQFCAELRIDMQGESLPSPQRRRARVSLIVAAIPFVNRSCLRRRVCIDDRGIMPGRSPCGGM
jgi:hypothetical protein